MRSSWRVGGTSSSAALHPNSGALASSNTRVHTGRLDKGGGEEKCHGCKKIAEEETDEGDVDGEDLHGRGEGGGGIHFETVII